MVPTDTLDRGGYMGGRCVALTWSSEIDGRPDWPSDHMPAPWPDVWFECSSLSTHCSKVRGSTSVGTDFAHTSTRPSVRTHRGRHPARSGRPRGARRKVTIRGLLPRINHPAKGPAPPESILFSVPVGVRALKKKEKKEKEGDKQGTSHLSAMRETTWLLSQAQAMALGSSFARAAYLSLRCKASACG